MMKTEELKLVTEWDKTFARSERVTHRKVTFVNRYGITLAADMYVPEDAVGSLPAIAVCGFRTVCPDYGRARLSDDRLRPVLYR